MSMCDEVNSLEIIEFTLSNNYYGVPTSLINEILAYQNVTPVPNAHPSVEGVFMPRGKMMTAIDLGNCLQVGMADKDGFFVVTQVDNMEIAFHIDSVVGVHKVEKEEIRDIIHFAPTDGYIEGVIKIKDKLVILLNFENIVRDISIDNLCLQEENLVENLVVE